MNAPLLSNLGIELFLVGIACVLILLGTSGKASSRHMAPVIALTSLACVFFYQLAVIGGELRPGMSGVDDTSTLNIGSFTEYVRLLVSGVGVVLVLLAWPTNRDATGSESLHFGRDAGEFFGLMVLSLTGVMLAAGANDIILLFLAVELASIPTYIMVSISRPLAVAQEAGVKYFFLGAMAAALMLFGFSYLYGTTGVTKLYAGRVNVNAASVEEMHLRLKLSLDDASEIDAARVAARVAGHPINTLDELRHALLARAKEGDRSRWDAIFGRIAPLVSLQPDSILEFFSAGGAAPNSTGPNSTGKAPWNNWTTWQKMALLVLFTGFAFKIAAVPLHAYAGDVYQGAATPVTAFLAFVPKTSGFIAIIKVLSAVGGGSWSWMEPVTLHLDWSLHPMVVQFLWIIAALTMSVGNVLALIQGINVKRVLAYSSVAHSGYMLVGLTALAKAGAAYPRDPAFAAHVQSIALAGVLFYLAAYAVMNSGAFGVLMLLPSREPQDYGPLSSRGGPPQPPVATTAETYDDLAGQGKRHVVIGLAMAVCCFSLIGIPLTVGFVGKVYLIQPALDSGLFWLVVITVVNAAVSAAYYLKIVATMFLRPEPDAEFGAASAGPATVSTSGGVAMVHHRAGLIRLAHAPFPLAAGVLLSVAGTLLFGTVIPATNGLTHDVQKAAGLDTAPSAPTARGPGSSAVAAR